MRFLPILLAIVAFNPAIAAPKVPSAIYTDPVQDTAHPARMEVLHIPSGGALINGVAYLAAGPGPHPTIVICHGLPGNEKNLDLAQAVRRAGWNAITFNYRGSWGSPGSFRFAQNPEDAAAVLAYIRDSTNSKKLGIDTSHIVLAGHSMGGWVAAMTSANDATLRGTILISAANMGALGRMPRAEIMKEMVGDMESLFDTTPDAMTEEVVASAQAFDFIGRAEPLSRKPLLALTSDDGLAPMADALVAAVRAAGGTQVEAVHVATDHSWSDRRIRLQTEILNWLAKLK
ncbi:alpha/beta hydrolase family protein [Aquisediminimonas profunda]|uniref:alpha/beta hydrolase family protein n=1 Tax=Aquisediminimonas profunda TaxID=1550733 RepID=UPI001FE7558E|nr:alpha/beta hydrolase [Aquisediminimonas profunda]